MGAFGEMVPGRKLGRVARDEDSDGEGYGLPDGPLDLDSGVVRVVAPHDEARGNETQGDETQGDETQGDETQRDETQRDETQRDDADR